MRVHLPGLTPEQRDLVVGWLGEPELVSEHSWGLVDTVVLRVRAAGRDLTVKAAGPANHHIGRELDAHERWTGPLLDGDRAPRLVHADRGARVLVATWLPGDLAQDGPAQHDPEVHRQAGALLARLHQQTAGVDDGWEATQRTRVLTWLGRDHRIPEEQEARVRELVAGWPDEPAVVAPTHGDYQPRNWLWDDGTVRVIDFGRAAMRPPATDLARLASREWLGRPELETAFLEGYGEDPREAGAWSRMQLAEAVGTAAWAYQVGDEAFEAQGMRMLTDALAAS
ncbi:MAG: aminoglycoside phosphotransferase [Acidobacteria bacterium]|nr:MAG: aminoglycoside phosphotransferase [Acidobacteriota bacterium]